VLNIYTPRKWTGVEKERLVQPEPEKDMRRVLEGPTWLVQGSGSF
jgi:hypothetical protein